MNKDCEEKKTVYPNGNLPPMSIETMLAILARMAQTLIEQNEERKRRK